MRLFTLGGRPINHKPTTQLTYTLHHWVTTKLSWQEQTEVLACLLELNNMSQSYPYARLMHETLFHKSSGLLLSQLTERRKETIQASLPHILTRMCDGDFDRERVLDAIALVLKHCPDKHWVEHWTYIYDVLDNL